MGFIRGTRSREKSWDDLCLKKIDRFDRRKGASRAGSEIPRSQPPSAGPENYFEPRILAVRNSTAIRIATIVAVVKASDRMTSGARPTWTWTICRNAAAVSTAAARIATSRLTRNTMIGSITLIRTILGWARQGPFDIGGLR
jgi:hypothetical protein